MTFYNAGCWYRFRRFGECYKALIGLLRELPSVTKASTLLRQTLKRLQALNHEAVERGDTKVSFLLRKTLLRLQKQNHEAYDSELMHEAVKRGDFDIDAATFSKSVTMKPSGRHGLGLFAARDVSAGNLLLCEAAMSYCFANSTTATYTNRYNHPSIRGELNDLLTTTIQNLFQRSPRMKDFTTLYRAVTLFP